VGIIYAPENPVRAQYSGAIEEVNARLRLELTALEAHDAAQIEQDIQAFARAPHGALLVLPGPSTSAHRDTIIAAAMGARLPAIYPFPLFVKSGGLTSYGTDVNDAFRRAASYVDRILRGEKPGDLPVQQPTKFELLINLKTAKALGLEILPRPLRGGAARAPEGQTGRCGAADKPLHYDAATGMRVR
jgi:putative ABC transport system substrate-binding protein